LASTFPAPVLGVEAVPTRRRLLWEPALIGLLALVLNLAGNGRMSLFDRDEPRYATCVREMRARGDWIYPTFNGEPRYHKPILIYWLMRGGVAIGGDNPFGARLVSALAGAGACLVVWSLGRRMLGARAGTLAALMYATAPIVVAESKLATTDATLALWVLGAQYCLWELARRPSPRLAALFWTLMALAALTKGPVGPALVAMSGVVSWWWGGPTACWRRLHWRWGLAWFVVLTAPWLVAVGILSHGEFFRFAIGGQVVNRVTSGMEKHAGFPGYYLVTMLGTFHPWSALVPAAFLGAWSRRREHPAFGFLLGWMLGPLILLECVQTKMVHYYLPALPACALLASWLVVAVARDEVNLRRWPLGRLAVGLLAGTAFVLFVALAAGSVMLPASLRWPLLTLAAVVAVGTLLALARLHRGATEPAVLGLAVTWGVVMLGAGGWLLPAAEPYRTSRVVGERLAAISAERKVQPVLHSFQEPSVVYAFGRPLPTIRTWTELNALTAREGTLLTALLPHEYRVFRTREEYEMEPLETLSGFNINRGEVEELRFVLIRESPSARQARLEEPLVK
jgi:4-amino-4-deoxy-L-arabinose transferase-like glycosyltransferase